MLLEAWRKFEQQGEAGSEEQKGRAVNAVEQRMPKRIKRKRPIETDDGSNVGMEVGLATTLKGKLMDLLLDVGHIDKWRRSSVAVIGAATLPKDNIQRHVASRYVQRT